MAVARFLSTPIGRILRAVAGLVLVVVGIWVIGGTLGIVIGLLGLVPIAAATLHLCLIGPLIGGHLDGRKNLEGGR
jgi:hypothetical protein